MGAPLVWAASTVITALRNTVGDPSGASVGRWTAAELDSYYNRAQLQVVGDTTKVLETIWFASPTDGQREYKLPAGFFQAKTVIYAPTTADHRVLNALNTDEYNAWVRGDETNEAEPTDYYFWRKLGDDPTTTQPPSIFLHPTPSTTVTTDNAATGLIVYGYKHPDTIDSTANPTFVVELEAPYVEAALMYAAHLVHLDDGDEGRARSRLEMYQSRITMVKESIITKDRSRPSRMMAKGARFNDLVSDPRSRIRRLL